MSIRISQGSIADLDAVMNVMEDSFDSRYGEAWTGPQFAGLLPMPGVWLNLARRDGRVVGFALSRAVADEAELLLLAVHREAQRGGVGRLLIDRFLSEARALGADRVHLEVREGNGAISLYESCGFNLVGRRRNYYEGVDGACFDALTLGRTMTR